MTYRIESQDLATSEYCWRCCEGIYSSSDEAQRAIHNLLALGGAWSRRAYRVRPIQKTAPTNADLVRLVERLSSEGVELAFWSGEDGSEAVLFEEDEIAAAVPGGPVRRGWVFDRPIKAVVRELVAEDQEAVAQARAAVVEAQERAAVQARKRAAAQESERVAKQERERAEGQQRARGAAEERELVAAVEAQQRAVARDRERAVAIEAQRRADALEQERAVAIEAQQRAAARELERVAKQEREPAPAAAVQQRAAARACRQAGARTRGDARAERRSHDGDDHAAGLDLGAGCGGRSARVCRARCFVREDRR